MKFPTLYKQNQEGKILTWEIWTEGNVIHTRFGQLDGKLQTGQDVIREGKNAGRKNATTPAQQADVEAKASHQKKLKSGYVTSLHKAKCGEVDDVIEGGVLPMLAKVFQKQEKKVVYPVAVQPKFDGQRCLAVYEGGEVTLWSRTRKPINSVPHILEAVRTALRASVGAKKSVILDGELYVHDHKDDFNKIMHLVRGDEPVEGHEQIEYHVYDTVAESDYKTRLAFLVALAGFESPLVQVDTRIAATRKEIQDHYETFLNAGYEGAMVRDLNTGYEIGKRSAALLKLKQFEDAEFEVVGFEEGTGKLMGHVGAAIVKLPGGLTNKAKLAGKQEVLKEIWENQKAWLGKMLTVQYQGWTPEKKLRFPVGLRFREDL